MNSVYVVDGVRTPFLKAQNGLGPFSASDLGVLTVRQLLARQPIEATDFDEVITGCVMPSPNEANISRLIALRTGCGHKVPAWTVQRNCASGMQAVDTAFRQILSTQSKLVLCGGTEAMSHAPLLLNTSMTNWLAKWVRTRTLEQRLKLLLQVRPKYFIPVIALLRGLIDPWVGLNMGQTAEQLAYRFKITRESMDRWAARSHQQVAAAIDEGYFGECLAIIDPKRGHVFEWDNGLRRDTSLEKLSKLKPFFDKKYGMVTAANSSQVSDGATFLILADEATVEKHQLPVLARIIDSQWAGLDPTEMGLGPVHAATPLLKRHALSLEDIDYFEINEAFAAQVIACLRAWEDKHYCQTQLGLDQAFGSIPEEKLNVDGGAIALGHPVGASGARIILHLAHILKRNQARYGLASICIGGGQGGAMLIERV